MIQLLILLFALDTRQVLDLPPSPGNPRNTEGAFVTLKDGRVMFAYTR